MRIGALIVWYNPCINAPPMAKLQMSEGKKTAFRHTWG